MPTVRCLSYSPQCLSDEQMKERGFTFALRHVWGRSLRQYPEDYASNKIDFLAEFERFILLLCCLGKVPLTMLLRQG